MNRFVWLLVLNVAFLFPSVAHAAKQKLAVLEFTGIGIESNLLLVYSDAVRSGLIKVVDTDEFLLMTPESIKENLKDMGKDNSCLEGECEVEIARNINADYVVSGMVTKVSDYYVVTLKLHDVSNAALLASDSVRDEDEIALMDKVSTLGQEIIIMGLKIKIDSNAPELKQRFSGSMKDDWGVGELTQDGQISTESSGTTVPSASDEQFVRTPPRVSPTLNYSDLMDRNTQIKNKKEHEKRKKSIVKARQILNSGTLVGEHKALMQFRLAELYFKEGQYYHFYEMVEYKKIRDDCLIIPQSCDGKTLQVDNSKSLKWYRSSIRLNYEIEENFPQYKGMDKVLFSVANTFQEINLLDEAFATFSRLTTQYPNSDYVPMAHLQIAEYYFWKNNFEQAILVYQQVSLYENFTDYGFTIYKLAWCYFNLGQYDIALGIMEQVIEYSKGGEVRLEIQANKDYDLFLTFKGP